MKLHIVPARTGFTWVRLGTRTFLRQPLALAGLFFMFMALVTVLALVPVVGSVVALVLVPAATLGIMAASREADAGRFPMPSLLLTGFRADRQRTRTLLTLGLIYAVAVAVVLGLAALVGGDPASAPPPPADADPAELARDALLGGGLWLAMLLYVPIGMAFWHAPALTHWHGIGPAQSLFYSFMACWANKGAMLAYMAGWVFMFMASSVLLSLMAALLGPALLGVVLYPMVLLMASLFHASVYFTYRDSFQTDDTPADTAAT